jgi:hypothetical protein
MHLVHCDMSNHLPACRGAAHTALRGVHQEKKQMISNTMIGNTMISNAWKRATVLGVASAIALSVASAEARDVRKAAPIRGAVASDHYVHQPSLRGSYDYRGSYNYEAGPRNGGLYFGEPNGPSNYNPNAN